MQRRRIGAVVVALALLLPLSGVSANHGPIPPRTLPDMTITPDTSPLTWQGSVALGTNVGFAGTGYNFDTGEPCHPAPDPRYCDIALLHVDLSAHAGYWDTRGGGVQVRLSDYTVAADDFDLQIFNSDAAGTKGSLVGTSGAPAGSPENFTIGLADGYYLIQVVYFAAAGNYTGELKFVDRSKTGPDVDAPAGLQEVLASNPALGFRSHSEPHIAQNPRDPNVLVAGSKMYNLDPDSLPEYEFKIGSYVSFDRASSWTDLGQLRTCPPDEAPASSWPNNTCYPAEDPARDGTGVEDEGRLPLLRVESAPSGSRVAVGENLVGKEFTTASHLTEEGLGAPVFVADDGFGCDWSTAAASGALDWIGVVRRGGEACSTFAEKFTAATLAGADALVMVHTDDNLPAEGPTVAAAIPGLLITKSDGDRLVDTVGGGTVEATVGILPTKTLRGGGGDEAEEYIVSDVWVQFDDEGNAYAMVLDAPPFSSGRGWGMTLHRWASVSPHDLVTGETWGPRIPISAYDEDVEQKLFLDDKNTFAVNNAGPDGDGETGIMIACWGKNVPDAIKQAIVCRRSTDGGQTWPDDGERILNGGEQLGIGVHVVADPNDENRFYAVWLQYATGIAGAPDTMQFSQTLDGGLSWLPPVTIATLDGIPRQFPGQSFRNLSIPIMAVGSASELYVTYADYREAPDPDADADGMQADVMLVGSELMGLPGTWSEPVAVNQDATNADQFQPYVTVAPDGEVNVVYFDRRHDPDNFYIDTYLSRSADGGRTFSDTRLSHDVWDPSVNPPISTSGDFIGDYQGLVADECFAIPFVNDTHLANAATRDPDHDGAMPRSVFQEVFSWQVPIADCEIPVLARAKGSGSVPGAAGETARFGLNVREDAEGARGRVHVDDAAAGKTIATTSILSVKRSGSTATVVGLCSVNGGPAENCKFIVVDGSPDEFHASVGDGGARYSAGGSVSKGSVVVQ